MATRPQIMPLTPPRKVGLRSFPNVMSAMIQVIIATAVARLVLTRAAVASAPAKLGAPAVKPVPAQPQDPGADRHEQQVVRHRLLPVAGQPRAHHGGGD